jgi:hypothetical protein
MGLAFALTAGALGAGGAGAPCWAITGEKDRIARQIPAIKCLVIKKTPCLNFGWSHVRQKVGPE